MFKKIFQSLEKFRKLKKISRKLSYTKTYEVSNEKIEKEITNHVKTSRTASNPYESFSKIDKLLTNKMLDERRKSNKENVDIEYRKDEFVGRVLAKPVYKDRTEDFIDEYTGRVIKSKEIEELRKNTSGGVTEDEFRILREVLFPEGTILTMQKIEDIINTGYTYVELYKTEPILTDKQKEALNELLDLAESDEYVQKVMKEYCVNRKTLIDLYNKLILAGAGDYSKGHFVAASSLVYPITLTYLLKHYQGDKFLIKDYDNNKSLKFISNRLFDYFYDRDERWFKD